MLITLEISESCTLSFPLRDMAIVLIEPKYSEAARLHRCLLRPAAAEPACIP
ncbi:MAG TPA: hypothetical protein VJN92_20245 [Candidatus Acidoferrum sp.]|nr:hypothetical protein [Candidatus Acidoferrum sp.]